MPIDNGVNLQPSYYNNGDVDFAWGLMKSQTKIKTVRIEIEPSKTIQARGWIQQACGHGYTVIATYHKYSAPLGTNNRSELMNAANWWATNLASLLSAPARYTVKPGDTLSGIADRYYADQRQYPAIFQANRAVLTNQNQIRPGQVLTIPARSRSFTINIMNEWGSHSLTAREYADAYNAAIGIVRRVYRGRLILDLPGYAQETAVAASAVKGYNTGGIKITDTDIMLSVHIYRQAFVQQKRGSSLFPDHPICSSSIASSAREDVHATIRRGRSGQDSSPCSTP